MIYLLVFLEFLKIGTFAIGGGLVTVPFVFELGDKYAWFAKQEIVDAWAILQSIPGAMGVNLAAYTGYITAGVGGSFAAGIGIVVTPIFIIMWLAKYVKKYYEHPKFQAVLAGVRPMVIAAILLATIEVFRIAVTDVWTFVLCAVFFCAMMLYRRSPIFYIIIGAVVGVVFGL